MSNQENNKLIAEFMGLELEETLEGMFVYARKEQSHIKLNDIRTEFYEVHELQYHISWDWLMPVVEKIESLGYEFFIVEDRIKIAHNTYHSTEIIINFTLGRNYGSKREAVYQGVVEFINQLNK